MVFSCGSVGLENPLCSTSLRTGLTRSSKAFLGESFNGGYASMLKEISIETRVKAFCINRVATLHCLGVVNVFFLGL